MLEQFDHKNLNLDVENFRTRVPTTENLCLEIYNLLRDPLEKAGSGRRVRLDRVRLEETSLEFFRMRGRTRRAGRKEYDEQSYESG